MAYQQLKGTGVALITPFQKNGSIDFPALEKLVHNVIKGGVDFLVALGTTAETPTLTSAEKQEVLSAVVKYSDGKVPVVCGIGGNNTEEVIHQLKTMNLQGVDGILSVAPYYNKPTQEGMYQHFKAVAAATNKPIILYNVPGRTGSNLQPATAIRLATDCKNIIGIKEASGNIVQNMELIQNKPDDFIVLSGDDNLVLAQMAIGMEGIISVAANCFTKDMTDIINLSIVGKFDKARKVHYKLLTGLDLLFVDGNPPGVKYVLSKQGVCSNIFRLPVVPVSDTTAKKLDAFLKTL
ncbi:MAG: dihydrodipicolinate synthase [Flavipsychrobacter sp.]|jgi:4-hydroxy-tetrahydrodipicolinate synthase|nr:dihydrodipicolinate synthase [Flavipsychrobacter sp.]